MVAGSSVSCAEELSMHEVSPAFFILSFCGHMWVLSLLLATWNPGSEAHAPCPIVHLYCCLGHTQLQIGLVCCGVQLKQTMKVMRGKSCLWTKMGRLPHVD
jgi:hypothetical protein